jgi:hypothetical protein
MVTVEREHVDDRVQIAVFDVEFNQTTLDILYISHFSQLNSFGGTTRIANNIAHKLRHGA